MRLNTLVAGVLFCGLSIGHAATAGSAQPSKEGKAGLGIWPASQPAAKADAPATKPAQELIGKGLSLLNEDKNAEALKAFQEANAGYGRAVKFVDDNHILAVHGMMVAYMRAGEHPKSKPLMERLIAAPKTNRSLILNCAKVDITSKATAIRAVALLDKYVATHTDDETAVNLMGVAMDTAARNRQNISKYLDNYKKYEAALEQSRRQKMGRTLSSALVKRWGTSWITESEYGMIQVRRNGADREITNETHRMEDLQVRLKTARQELASIQGQTLRGGGRINQSTIRFHQEQIDRYDLEIRQQQDRIDQLEKNRPMPTWTDTFQPLIPERELVAKVQ